MKSYRLEKCTTFATPRSFEDYKKLVKKLENKLGKKVLPTFTEDKSLIGGIKIVMEDEVLDGSLEKRLKDLKEVIKQ